MTTIRISISVNAVFIMFVSFIVLVFVLVIYKSVFGYERVHGYSSVLLQTGPVYHGRVNNVFFRSFRANS